MIRMAHGSALGVAVTIVTLAALLMALSGPKPAQTAHLEGALPSGQPPLAFEEEGDIWVVIKMHPANLTPDTAAYNDLDPAVSPEGRRIAFASDRDGDFEIYMASVFTTGEVQRLTDNAVDDRKPVWSPDSRWISYKSPHYSSPTHSGIFSTKVEGAAAP